MQKYRQSSISYFEANHLLNHYSPFIWQIWNPIYKKTFNHWRHTSRLFKRWAGLHGFSDLYLEHGCGIPMEHSAAPRGKYKNQLLDRLESHIPLFQMLGSPTPSNPSSWNIRQMGISRRPFCQHEWVSNISKLTLQAKFYGNSTTKLKKLGGFRLVSDV